MNWSEPQKRLNALGYQLSVDNVAGPKTYGALFAYLGGNHNSPILGKSAAEHFPAYRIETPLRIAHWLAQFSVESRGFTRFEEDLRYTAGRLCVVWPKRFTSLAMAQQFANNPEALANKVYGGRMGNDQPGDGWLFRGRGPGLTGRENYTACATRTGLPLDTDPDLAGKPDNFVHIACDFWAQNCLNGQADNDDLRAITVLINGGTTGLQDRAAALVKAKRVLLP